MDILFQIHYEWNKELFCLYYQTQNRKYRRILLFFCGAVIIFSFCLCSKIGGNFHFFMKNYDMKFLLRLRFCELGYLFKAVEAAVLLLQVLCKRKHDVFRSLFIFQYRYSQHKHHPRVVMFYTSL